MFSLQAGMEPKGWSLGEAGWSTASSPSPTSFPAAASDGWERVQQLISPGSHIADVVQGTTTLLFNKKNPACVLDRWICKYPWLKNRMAFLIWVDRRRCGWGWETEMGSQLWKSGRVQRVSCTVFLSRGMELLCTVGGCCPLMGTGPQFLCVL